MRVLQVHLSVPNGGAYTCVKNLSYGFNKIGIKSEEVFYNPIKKLMDFDYDSVLVHSFQGRNIDQYIETLNFLDNYKIPHVILLHDYWPICVQTNLTSYKNGIQECKEIDCNPDKCNYFCNKSNIDYVNIKKIKEIYSIIKDSKTVCFNKYSVDIFKDRGFSNIKLIYHGVNLDLFKPNNKSKEEFTVLFTNAWGEKEIKGFKHWNWLKNNNSNIIFKELLGSKSLEYMPEFYNSGNCLLFLSLWPETFGLVILEALACDIPVISYPVGIAREIIKNGENGYLIDDYNIKSVNESIKLINKNKYNCRDSIKEFNIENTCLKYIEFLGE